MEIDKNIYYNFNRLMSYNGLFNFVLSPRGNGKSYGAKERVIKNFIKNKEQFIYVRRYKTEKGILLKRVLYGIIAKKV